jgi:hypothetical protein
MCQIMAHERVFLFSIIKEGKVMYLIVSRANHPMTFRNMVNFRYSVLPEGGSVS